MLGYSGVGAISPRGQTRCRADRVRRCCCAAAVGATAQAKIVIIHGKAYGELPKPGTRRAAVAVHGVSVHRGRKPAPARPMAAVR